MRSYGWTVAERVARVLWIFARAALAIIALVVVGSRCAHAAGTAYQWNGNGANFYDSTHLACAQRATTFTLPPTDSWDGAAFVPAPGATSWTWPGPALCNRARKNTITGVPSGQTSVTMNFRANPEGSPECPSSGVRRSMVALDGTQAAGTKTCGSDGCQYKWVGGAATTTLTAFGFLPIHTGESTGVACAQAFTPDIDESNEDCQSLSGTVACGAGTNCGEVNGDLVCPKAIKDGCVSYDSGAVACVSTAGTPPKPDNGTPSTPATPVAQVTQGSTTVNYYNTTTVNNSSVAPVTGPPSSSGPGGSEGGGGTCSGDECGEGSGSASGGEECDVPPTCDGDAIMCAVLAQEWQLRCDHEVPTAEEIGLPAEGEPGSALNEETHSMEDAIIADGFLSGGSCPADMTMNLGDWGSIEFPLSTYCWIFELIGLAVLAGAWISAAKIVVGVAPGQGA